MDNNQQQSQGGSLKTYITENNQNRSEEPLKAEQADAQLTEDGSNNTKAAKLQSDEMSTAGAITPQGEAHEPEALNAEAATGEFPPTTATVDAEEVAGKPVGEIYGQEGEWEAQPDGSYKQEETDEAEPEEPISSPS